MITRIGIISDTHIPEAGAALPDPLWEAFAGVDLILHAGDIHDLKVLDWLERVAPVRGVRGNGEDGSGGRARQPDDHRLKRADVLTINGIRIGVVHDVPLPEVPPDWTLECTVQREFGGPVDVIVCGHTHIEGIATVKGIMIVNPGSPTLPHNLAPRYGTVGILDIAGGNVTARIVPLWDLGYDGYASGSTPVPPGLTAQVWRGSGPWWGQWSRKLSAEC
ncbi:MAG: metallophosphoesterase family protein [Chloroflexi bacterium]|nr:metallophosphoesterase family protein [Chloroflexota bacterium]